MATNAFFWSKHLKWLLMASTALTGMIGSRAALSEEVVVHDGGSTRIATPTGGNGVPVIDIAAPNGKGVSHNQYDKFNVGTVGLVLNNADAVTQSKLAGHLPGNSNFSSGTAASLILNEVVAANRSTLAGYTEVAGRKAEVVIANPYGITCSGCGFINTPRVTLTTGKPSLRGDGSLDSFTVNRGDISVTGAGLDASNQEIFDLVARQISVDGPITASSGSATSPGLDLTLAAGNNHWDYGTRKVTGTVAGEGALPDNSYAIDTSLLGGMYANRVRLIATEAGVGVRMLGDAAATGGDFTLTAAGKVVLNGGHVSAEADVAITTSASETDAFRMTGGAVTAGGNVSLTNTGSGGAALSGGYVTASGKLTVTQGALSDTGNGTTDTTKFDRSAGGAVTITTTDAADFKAVSYHTPGALTVVAKTVSTDPSAFVSFDGGSDITFTATGPDTTANSTTKPALDLNGAGIRSAGTLSVTAQQGGIAVAAGGVLQSTSGNVVLAAATTLVNAGGISADAGSLTVRSTNSGAGTLALTNTGTLNAGAGALDIAGFGASPNAAVTLTNTASGLMLGQTVSVKAASFDNSGGLQGTNTASFAITDALTNRAGGILITSANVVTGQTEQISAGSVLNAGVLQSANALAVTATTSLSNSDTLVAAGGLSITGGSAGTTLAVANTGSGFLQAGGALSISGAAGGQAATLTVAQGATVRGSTLTLNTQSVTNAGTVQGTNGTTLNISTLDNSGTFILSTGAGQDESLTLQSFTNLGTLQSGGALTLTATDAFDNFGSVLAANALTVQGSGASVLAVTNEATGVLQAGGALSITGANGGTSLTLTNASGGTILGGGTLTVAGQSITNAGTLQGASGGTVTSSGALDNQGVLTLST
ncbi:MAG: filamentous hemagglutinin N-terminal domain-containing protein, partial [Azospirillum sp.]|nr:filamentous hemagglutinin N-terminal domain-containing protein [Azospirillum sp.]